MRDGGEFRFRRRCFNFNVDLSSKKQHQPGDVEPHEKDDDCSKRAVSERKTVEEMQVGPETQ